MRQLALITAAGALLSACIPQASQDYVASQIRSSPNYEILATTTLTEKQAAAVRDGVRRRLRDPDSARFGNMVAGKGSKGDITVCGWVNAKNGFGGYTGDQPFYGMLAEGTKGAVFVPINVGGKESEQEVTMITCREYGLYMS